FVFFFPAEDGIRDRNVTGVQTCALPIFKECVIAHWSRDPASKISGAKFGTETVDPIRMVEERCIRTEATPKGVVDCIQARMLARSEERRVGKEGRGGRSMSE